MARKARFMMLQRRKLRRQMLSMCPKWPHFHCSCFFVLRNRIDAIIKYIVSVYVSIFNCYEVSRTKSYCADRIQNEISQRFIVEMSTQSKLFINRRPGLLKYSTLSGQFYKQKFLMEVLSHSRRQVSGREHGSFSISSERPRSLIRIQFFQSSRIMSLRRIRWQYSSIINSEAKSRFQNISIRPLYTDSNYLLFCFLLFLFGVLLYLY